MTRPVEFGSNRASGRTRPRRALVVLPLVLGLCAVSLTACSKESVTPATSPVAYVALGATVANPGSTVAVVNTKSAAQGRPITTGTLPSGLALVPAAKELLVVDKADNELVVVSTASGKVTHRISVGLEPVAVAATTDGTQPWKPVNISVASYPGGLRLIEQTSIGGEFTVFSSKSPTGPWPAGMT